MSLFPPRLPPSLRSFLPLAALKGRCLPLFPFIPLGTSPSITSTQWRSTSQPHAIKEEEEEEDEDVIPPFGPTSTAPCSLVGGWAWRGSDEFRIVSPPSTLTPTMVNGRHVTSSSMPVSMPSRPTMLSHAHDRRGKRPPWPIFGILWRRTPHTATNCPVATGPAAVIAATSLVVGWH